MHDTNNWFTCLSDIQQAERRLFIFPFAGGGPDSFRQWVPLLPTTEIWVACLPGREKHIGVSYVTRMDELISSLLPAIMPFLDREFSFLGHSMGGLIAFELVHALKNQGLIQPGHLFISACQSPNIIPSSHRLNDLPDEKFILELQRYGGLPEELSTEVTQIILPLLRADLSIPANYRPQIRSPLSVPVTAFCGSLDKMVTWQNMQGWHDTTTMRFTLYDIPGDHFFLHAQRNQLIKIITDEIVTSNTTQV